MVVIGAKGFAKEILTTLFWNHSDLENVYLFDDINSDVPDKVFEQFVVIRKWEDLAHHFNTNSTEFILGVGGPDSRKCIAEKACAIGGQLTTLISDQALIGAYGVSISAGACVLANSIITVDVRIGEGTLINKAVSISHDVMIGDYCEISPGARILGRVTIGDQTEIGTNAVILPKVKIGSHCKIGAGAVVTKDVDDGVTVVGIPAKPIN